MSLEYIAPGEALELAGRRLRNSVLQEKISRYLGGVWPQGFEDIQSPAAVYAPYLAKGSVTEVDFLHQANTNGFMAAVATYESAEYVTANPSIVDCYRAPLVLPKGRERRWVVPEGARSGAVGVAPTMYQGIDIVDYWRGLRISVLEENRLTTADRVVDFGDWYALQARRFGWAGERSKSPFYYMAAMALYTSGRAVLFDTPPTEFAGRVMVPAYLAARDSLGVVPLVTDELSPGKRDWTDVSFLDDSQVHNLQTTGRIGS